MSQWTYYHNPRCSKSRQGLVLVQESGIDFNIKEYLKEGLNAPELDELFQKLGRDPLECMRTKEGIFKELELKNKDLTRAEWIATIVEHPVLLERPILEGPDRAVIGRPPENINEILS